MAGAGFKTFNTGDVLTASDVNTYLMQQTVMVFADSSARSTALGANVAEGMLSYLEDTNAVEKYDGSSWVAVGGAGLTSPLTTKGDVWGYSTTDARIPVGADGTFLTSDSGEALGVKWSAGAKYELISTTALTSGTSVNISSIPATYKDLRLIIEGVQPNVTANLSMNFNNTSNGNVYNMGWYVNSAPTTTTTQGFSTGSEGVRLYGTSVRSGNGSSSYSINIYNYADSTVWKTGDFRGTFLQGANHGEFCGGFFGAHYTAAISSIRLFWTNGTSTFSAGNALLYGVS